MRATPWLTLEMCTAAGLLLSERAALLPLGDTIAPGEKFVRYVLVRTLAICCPPLLARNFSCVPG